MGKLGNADFFGSVLMNENTQIESDAFFVEGQVKWFDAVKGFGFVLSDDGGPDILLHANVLRNFGQGSVADASKIELKVQRTERGLQAIEVVSITPPEPEADQEDVFALDVDLDDVDLTPARVKWFDKAKGFGFANAYGSSDDIFLHVEVLRRCGLADLQAGEAVCVRVVDGARGHMAAAVYYWDYAITND
jgi:CspA family cold shock protein